METVNSLVTDLGLPMKRSKTVGPVTKMTFLGIEIDTQARLPEEKLGELKRLLVSWLCKKHCIKGDLETLAEKLQQAYRVVQPGRCFMQHFYAAISVAHQKRTLIRVNKSIQADIWWWHTFMQEWNGVSLLWNCGKQGVDEDVWTNTSGAWGCGALWGPYWFSIPWFRPLQEALQGFSQEDSITVREMIPVTLAAAMWGQEWEGKLFF